MIDITIQGDTQIIAKLDALPGKLSRALTKRLTSFALQMQAAIVQKLSGDILKVRTGALRRSIDYSVANTLTSITATVFSNNSVKYARIQEYGGTTRPHVIEAKPGGVLAFQSGGKTVFARRVNHPGSRIPARPFMRPTLAEFRARVQAGIQQDIQETIQ